jgi:hypothetical protein
MEPLLLLMLAIGVGAGGLLAQQRAEKRARRARRSLPVRSPTRGGLRAGDVVQHLGSDYVIESVVRLEEAAQVRLLCRLSGPRTPAAGGHLWLPERGDPEAGLWLLTERAVLPEPPPDVLTHGGLRYRLQRRFRIEAAYLLSGTHAELGSIQRALEYSSVGTARLLLLCRGENQPVTLLCGEALPRHLVEILPGPAT